MSLTSWSTSRSVALLVAATWSGACAGGEILAPASMKAIGTVDARFQSYNIEMVEITGGRFWKPYPRTARALGDQDRYSYRPPIDLRNPRLRVLAAALSPAYMRVSGTAANATYFFDSDGPSPAPPPGFDTILTRPQWRGVIGFARDVDAQIVTSFAISPGTRDADGAWTSEQAGRLVDYTRLLGGSIAGAEYMNEPTLAATGGAPAGYDAKAYGRDFQVFRAFLKQASPETKILGPGSVGEPDAASVSGIRTIDLLAVSGEGIDVFSYHYYGTVSPRCGGRDTPDEALSEDWLSRTDRALSFYRSLRDRFEPGKPLWLTETADAACGGNPWDATFLDTFRYLDQLGRLAKSGVEVVMHNTLTGSDYGLLDENDFEPRPNYWGALLWHRLMGRTVLAPGTSVAPGLHLYAHCLSDKPGGVAVLVLNTSHQTAQTLMLPTAAQRYTLQAPNLQSKTVQLNGRTLALGSNNKLPAITAASTPAGDLTLQPASITFLALPAAGNHACE